MKCAFPWIVLRLVGACFTLVLCCTGRAQDDVVLPEEQADSGPAGDRSRASEDLFFEDEEMITEEELRIFEEIDEEIAFPDEPSPEGAPTSVEDSPSPDDVIQPVLPNEGESRDDGDLAGSLDEMDPDMEISEEGAVEPAPVDLENVSFADENGDSIPDGWKVYPPILLNTRVKTSPLGGVIISDRSKEYGVGLYQYFRANPRHRYSLRCYVEESPVYVLFRFLSEKPERESDIARLTVEETQLWAEPASDEETGAAEVLVLGKDPWPMRSLEVVSPENAKYGMVWIYSPKRATGQVQFSHLEVLDHGALGSGDPRRYLLIGDNFDNSEFSEEWKLTRAPRSSPIQIVDFPTRRGAGSARFAVTYDDFQIGGLENRASYKAVLNVFRPGDERWFGFSNYLSYLFEDEALPTRLVSWHGMPDRNMGEPSRAPVLELSVYQGDYILTVRHDERLRSIPGRFGRGGSITEKVIWTAPYKKEQWDDWVFHCEWSYGSQGRIRVWRNDRLVLTYEGPNCYNDREGFGYFQIGLEKQSYSPDSVEETVVYFDEVRVARSTGTFKKVDPATASAVLSRAD